MIDPDDERTALSARKEPAPGRQHDGPDDRTQIASRSLGGAAQTAPRRSSAPSELDDTAVSARSAVTADSEVPTQAATESEPIGPRRSGSARSHEDAAARDRGAPGTATAPTGTPAPADGPLPYGRVAAAPAAGTPYRARPVPSAPASRTQPARRAPQTYVDTAAAEAGRRRRRRRSAIVVVAVASVLVIAAGIAIVALLTTA